MLPVGFIIRTYHDARSPESQMRMQSKAHLSELASVRTRITNPQKTHVSDSDGGVVVVTRPMLIANKL